MDAGGEEPWWSWCTAQKRGWVAADCWRKLTDVKQPRAKVAEGAQGGKVLQKMVVLPKRGIGGPVIPCCITFNVRKAPIRVFRRSEEC